MVVKVSRLLDKKKNINESILMYYFSDAFVSNIKGNCTELLPLHLSKTQKQN